MVLLFCFFSFTINAMRNCVIVCSVSCRRYDCTCPSKWQQKTLRNFNLCKGRGRLWRKKKTRTSGLRIRKHLWYPQCYTGRMSCLGSLRVLGGGNIAWLRGGRVGRISRMLMRLKVLKQDHWFYFTSTTLINALTCTLTVLLQYI